MRLKPSSAPDFPAAAVLPIARTGGASQLYFDLRDGGERVVAFVDGLPEWTGLRQRDSLLTIASSFVEYWERLLIDPDYAQQVVAQFDPRRGDARFVEDWLDSGLPGWRESLGERSRASCKVQPEELTDASLASVSSRVDSDS